MLKKLLLSSILLLVPVAAEAQVFPFFPIIGQGAYSCGQVNSVSDCTVPAGPPAITGNERLLLDTNLPSGTEPQTVLSTVNTLKAYINSGIIATCPVATIFITGCVQPDGSTIVINGSGVISALTGSGTVTEIDTTDGIVGGPITTTGTIGLGNSGVIPGTYTLLNATIDLHGRITSASTGTAITSITTGTGLAGGPITTSGTISLANTAVTPGSYTNANVTVDAQGRITAATNGTGGGSGTVTSVASGTGLTGGPITGSGTLALANTAVTPASYTNANITVDAQGRLTFASNGNAGTVTSIATGSGLSGGPITGTGTIACAMSTSSAFGCVKPDGTTITATGGVLSVVDFNGINGVAAFRLIPVINNLTVFLNYHTSPGDLGLGNFIGVTGMSPGTYVDDNGTVIIPTGGNGSAAWLRVWDGQNADMGWWGATFNHVTDDYAAWYNAVSYFSNGRTAIRSGALNVHGGFSHSKPLVYGGSNGNSLRIYGVLGDAFGGTTASYLTYTGPTTTAEMIFYGANKSGLENVGFVQNNALWAVHAVSDDNGVFNTTLNSGISAGSNVTITPASMANIVVGTALGLGPGGSTFEIVYAKTVGGSSFTADVQHPHSMGEQLGGGTPSSGFFMTGSQIAIPDNANAGAVLLCNITTGATPQVSEIILTKISMVGLNAGGAGSGIMQQQGGNCKNFDIVEASYSNLQIAFNLTVGSGYQNIYSSKGSNAFDAVFVQNGGVLNVYNFEDESPGMLIRGTGANLTANFFGGSMESTVPVDHIMAFYAGSLNFYGTQFVSSSYTIFKIGDPNSSSSVGSFSAVNSHFVNNNNSQAMVVDGSNNNVLDVSSGGSFATGVAGTKVTMLNNIGGPLGSPLTLNNIMPTDARVMQATPYAGSGSTASYPIWGGPNRTYSVAVLDKSLLIANATAQNMQLFTLPPRTRLTSVVVDVTTNFTGSPGASSIKCGSTSGGTDFILSNSITGGATQWGLVNADLGAALQTTSSTPIQGGYMPTANWTGAGAVWCGVTSAMTIGTGTVTNYTAGSATVYIETERFN